MASDRWDHIPSSFLGYWRERAKVAYIEDVLRPTVKKDGSRTAANLSQINIGSWVLRSISRELRARGEE